MSKIEVVNSEFDTGRYVSDFEEVVTNKPIDKGKRTPVHQTAVAFLEDCVEGDVVVNSIAEFEHQIEKTKHSRPFTGRRRRACKSAKEVAAARTYDSL
jgi:hypothetical protein